MAPRLDKLKALQQQFRDLDEEYRTFRTEFDGDTHGDNRSELFAGVSSNEEKTTANAKRASNDELLAEGKRVAEATTKQLATSFAELVESQAVG